jgi:hypothetical protein
MKIKDLQRVLLADVQVISERSVTSRRIIHFDGDLNSENVDPDVLDMEVDMIQAVGTGKIRILARTQAETEVLNYQSKEVDEIVRTTLHAAKLKVLPKQEIDKLLDEGNRLKCDNINMKIYIVDADNNKLGAVRFDTYLSMIPNLTKVSKSYWSHVDMYIKK